MSSFDKNRFSPQYDYACQHGVAQNILGAFVHDQGMALNLLVNQNYYSSDKHNHECNRTDPIIPVSALARPEVPQPHLAASQLRV